MITITAYCRECATFIDMIVDEFDLEAYRAGMLVGEAFPYLTADQRELIISGTCGACFDEMFGVVA